MRQERRQCNDGDFSADVIVAVRITYEIHRVSHDLGFFFLITQARTRK